LAVVAATTTFHCHILIITEHAVGRYRSFIHLPKYNKMKKISINTVLLWGLLYAVAAPAQTKTVTISGKVTSFEESLPLEGVSVVVKGSTNGTGTQADGTFSLSVSPGEKVLLLSLPGYEKKEIPITKSVEYNIVLKRSEGISYAIPFKQLAVAPLLPVAFATGRQGSEKLLNKTRGRTFIIILL
jgi:hypothetical protein